jgi:hypothetical protein
VGCALNSSRRARIRLIDFTTVDPVTAPSPPTPPESSLSFRSSLKIAKLITFGSTFRPGGADAGGGGGTTMRP